MVAETLGAGSSQQNLPIALIIKISGILGTFFLFYQRWTQAIGGLLAHDLAVDILALRLYPHQATYMAPYGQLWYAINLAIPHSTGLEWTLSIAAIDIPISILFLFKNWKLWIIYIFVSVLSFTSTPYNMPVLWLIGLGMYRGPTILLGPLAKIPDTIPQLQYVLSWSVRQPDNWFYYGLLGVWFFTVLLNTQWTRLNKAIPTLRRYITRMQDLPENK